MKELRQDQHDLELALPTGISLDEAREILRKRKIQYSDETEIGDISRRRLYARTRTDAWKFPCGFDRIVDLQFGPDERLEARDVRLFPMCP